MNWTNIGNAFIDLGAKNLLSDLQKELNFTMYDYSGGYDVVLKEGYIRSLPINILRFGYFFGDFITRVIKGRVSLSKIFNIKNKKSSYSFIKYLNPKYVIIPGMMLTKDGIKKVISQIPKDSKLIFLGAGGIYNKDTVNYISKVFKERKTNLFCLISREDLCFNIYHKYFDYSFPGVDCGFFVRFAYTPPKLGSKLIALTFDFLDEPLDIFSQYKYLLDGAIIVRPSHSYTLEEGYNIIHHFPKENLFVSDNVYDYLTIYYNSKYIFTDRIHAAVVGLSYGNFVKLYKIDDRINIFKKIGAENLVEKPIKIDGDVIKTFYNKIKKFLKDIVDL